MSETHVHLARGSAPGVPFPSPPTRRRHSKKRRAADRLLNVGFSCFAVALIAGGAAHVLPGGPLSPIVAAGMVFALLIVAYARVSAPERVRSLQPVRDLLLVGCAALVAASLVGRTSTTDLRSAAAVLAAVVGALALTVIARRMMTGTQSVLLVGDRLAVAQCIEHWEQRREVDIVGVCLVEQPHDASDRPTGLLGVPVVGSLDDAATIAMARAIDEVIVAPGPLVTAYDVRRLSWALERTKVRVGVTAEVHGAAPHRLRPRLLGRRVVLAVEPSARPRFQRALKGAIDRLVGGLLLGLFAPLIGLLALAVRFDSAGPAMFRQVRAGRDGRAFTMYKLRTMCDEAEKRLDDLREQNEGAGPLFKMLHDPRVTRIGRILRKTSLDELPQLINVVKGDMSLIGPRPGLPSEVEFYDEWVSRRLAVKPGMTGLWQVSGRSRLGWNDSVGLDLGYVDNWTIGGDLVIAAKTFKAVVQRDGAA